MAVVLKSVCVEVYRKSHLKLTGVSMIAWWLPDCENWEAQGSINEISIKCHLDWRLKSDVASNGCLMVLYPSAWSISKHAWQGIHSIGEHHQDFSILLR